MAWKEYINVSVIKTLSQHASGSIAAMCFFGLSAWVSTKLLPAQGIIHDIAEGVEKTAIIVILLYLFFQFIWHLFWRRAWQWIKGIDNDSTKIFMVA